MRLDRYVSEAMGISRKKASRLISSGLVTVNGRKALRGDEKVSPSDRVKRDGRLLLWEEFVYIMLNKPRGVVSASRDERSVTVADLVKDDFPGRKLFPAGRLDKDSTGLVLLTDDGRFAHRITSPKNHVPKKYLVKTDVPMEDGLVTAFEKGVTLADGSVTDSAVIEILPGGLCAVITLRQGMYHQIKRMLGVFGIGVVSLHRFAIGGLYLPDSLLPGEYIKLEKDLLSEISNLS